MTSSVQKLLIVKEELKLTQHAQMVHGPCGEAHNNQVTVSHACEASSANSHLCNLTQISLHGKQRKAQLLAQLVVHTHCKTFKMIKDLSTTSLISTMEIVMKDTSVMKAQHLQLPLMSPQMEENLAQLAIIVFLENNSLSLASLEQRMIKLFKVLVMTAQKENTAQTLQ